MRKILDKLFCNKKLGIFIPILIAIIVYLLFVVFGNSDDKLNAVIAAPLISVFWFFGIFLVVFVQVKNPTCPEWFLNLFELMITIITGIYGIISVIQFFADGCQNLDFGLCAGLVTYGSMCWLHSKRKGVNE